MSSSLPVPSQLRWSHATNSLDAVKSALSDRNITAIEADIMMGCYADAAGSRQYGPIMSHPPYEESDLSAARFLQLALSGPDEEFVSTRTSFGGLTDTPMMTCTAENNMPMHVLHIKLDFKQIEAVGPVLEMIQSTHRPRDGQMVFLNADILPGPGVRGPNAVTVQPQQFIETCFDCIDKMPNECATNFAFSLGYKADFKSGEAYTKQDAKDMSDVVAQYDIESHCGGIVLALNARTLALDPAVFDIFLSTYVDAQILAWTGAGEPPISQASIDTIKSHFDTTCTGCCARVGFDCEVE